MTGVRGHAQRVRFPDLSWDLRAFAGERPVAPSVNPSGVAFQRSLAAAVWGA